MTGWPQRALLIVLLTAGLAGNATAHELRPAYLELTERKPGEFDVLWKVPAAGGMPVAGEELLHELRAATPPAPDVADIPKPLPCGCPALTAAQFARGALPIHPALPEDAQILSVPQVTRLQGAEVMRWSIRTGSSGLDGWEVTVHGLPATMMDVLVRIALADGTVVSRLLRPDAPSFVFRAEHAENPAGAYFILGVEHILFGIDHLLFVLALLLVVRGAGLLVKTITAFTLAHSVTLALATLGVVHVPSAPVEAAIALSIVLVASEAVRGRAHSPGLTERVPWVVAGAFGLLHGFGFAGALAETGLPQNDIPMALLFFNIGVEVGQLIFVAAVLGVVRLLSRIRIPAWAALVPPYAIGSIAMFWTFERISAL